MSAIPERAAHPTPYPDVNALVCELLARVSDVLGDQFVGLYLHGSLAHGGFGEDSDIDFCVATVGELPDATRQDLAAMHARIAASGRPWATKLEGGYVPKQSLRRADPANAPYPCFDAENGLHLARDNGNVVLTLHVLRERGVVVAGPDPRTFVDPISPDGLRDAARAIMRDWWMPILEDPGRMRHPDYARYAVITMCRILYTLEHGAVVPKSVAARWARDAVDQRWRPLVKWWSSGRCGTEPEMRREALEFVRHTLERSERGGKARANGT